MSIDNLNEFIDYVCLSGNTPTTSLFTHEECISIENYAFKHSDTKTKKFIIKIKEQKNG
jgi:hypothetical protein